MNVSATYVATATMAILLLAASCTKGSSSSGEPTRSYSTCPLQVEWSLDYADQVDYKLTGINAYAYSSSTVCFRRLGSSGLPKTYSEIIDTRSNPNTYQTYHTYKKLGLDETGVKVYWLKLTDKSSGITTKYINYK